MKYHIEAQIRFRIVDDETLKTTHGASVWDDVHDLKGVALFLEKLGIAEWYIAELIEKIEQEIKWLEEEES